MGGTRAINPIQFGAALAFALAAAGVPFGPWGGAAVGALGGALLGWQLDRLGLGWRIGAGVALGVALGLGLPEAAPALRQVGRVFIALLKMLIAPMILLSIAHGIAGLGAGRDLGRLGARTLMLYVGTMAAAVVTGLVAVNLFQPGAGSDLLASEFFRDAVGRTPPPADAPDLGSFLLTTVFQIFSNPIESLVEGRVLPIVVFAVLFGIALAQIGEPARHLVSLLGAAYAAIMRMIGWFLELAPAGILGLVGHLVATVGLGPLLENLGELCLVVVAATLFHATITLPAVAWLLAGVGPNALFAGIRDALVVAFTTSSSAATLPVTTRCVEENLDVSPTVSSFVLPLGATVNMDGTALYEAIAAVFVATLYGVELGIGGQLVIFFVAMATAVGAPGIPSAGMVTMVVVLEAAGLPAQAVGLLLTVDRLLDTFRTMANVEGDAVVALCVDRLERRS